MQHLEQAVSQRDEEIVSRGARLVTLEEECANLKRMNADAESYVAHLERELEQRVRDVAVRDDALIELRARAEESAATVQALSEAVAAGDERSKHLKGEHEVE